MTRRPIQLENLSPLQRNLINSSLRKAKKTYFAEKLEESRPNPSEFWKTLKNVLPNKNVNCDIDRLIVYDKEVTGHKDIADAINSYFTSIASSLLANSNEMESEFAPDEAPLNIKPFKFTIRNVNEVSKSIEDLNQAKATGPDGIPVRALKMAAPNISPIVLMNRSPQVNFHLRGKQQR